MRYAIITGGWSPEKEENISGAKDVHTALSRDHQICTFVFDSQYSGERNKKIIEDIKKFSPDLVFLCTTEELPIQGVFEFLDIKYTGSNVLTTALSLDKEKCKLLFRINKIDTPDGILLQKEKAENIRNLKIKLGFPLVVKPNNGGSSWGISFVKTKRELAKKINEAFEITSDVLIEEFVKGTEITVPMLDDTIMPPIEIIKKKEIFDYEAKSHYKEKENVEYVIASLDENLRQEIDDIMRKLKQTFYLRNIFRADFIVTADKLVLLELNTLPCLANGMLGVSAQGLGWNYPILLEKIAQSALKDSDI